jgi:formylglycine-generating enzyme required for sulfatase activity
MALVVLARPAWADVLHMGSGLTSLDTVAVGNLGNLSDTRYDDSIGSVPYTFAMGKYDVTAGQYCEFLNAVGKTDTYGLYTADMWNSSQGCMIQRNGNSGSYTYSVAADWANRPANYVSYWDACRMANWLTNGQPTGAQTASTTENGSYTLNGYTGYDTDWTIRRNPNAVWVVPSANEWYKTAYFDPSKPGGAGYWDYPTRSSATPSNVLSATGTNNANYADFVNGPTIGSPYYRTEVGAFAKSAGAYGTFDQGGNVWQWTESVDVIDVGFSYRMAMGGSFLDNAIFMGAGSSQDENAPDTGSTLGFRLARVAPASPGDVNSDGVVNAADIDAVYAHFGPGYDRWDVNGDGVVNQADVTYLLKNILHRAYGDANLDGKVDFADFQLLLDRWVKPGNWAQGDFTGNGVVDFSDFQYVLDNWNPAGVSQSAVPEPATLCLLALGALAAIRRRRSRA